MMAISEIYPATGMEGQYVTIKGLGLSNSPLVTDGVVFSNNVKVVPANVVYWSDDLIRLMIPMGAITGDVYVISEGIATNSLFFEIISDTIEIEVTTELPTAIARTVQVLCYNLKEAVKGYIGLTVYELENIRDAITRVLETTQGFTEARFDMEFYPMQGLLLVDLYITPYGYIETIHVPITIKP